MTEDSKLKLHSSIKDESLKLSETFINKDNNEKFEENLKKENSDCKNQHVELKENYSTKSFYSSNDNLKKEFNYEKNNINVVEMQLENNQSSQLIQNKQSDSQNKILSNNTSINRVKGKCKWFNKIKGWGFITPVDGSEDVFVHQSSIKLAGFRGLKEGQEVDFETKITSRGLEAFNVDGIVDESNKNKKISTKKTRCYNCGEFTKHLASECDQSPQPKKCHHCKSEDHLIADCPLRVACLLLDEEEKTKNTKFENKINKNKIKLTNEIDEKTLNNQLKPNQNIDYKEKTEKVIEVVTPSCVENKKQNNLKSTCELKEQQLINKGCNELINYKKITRKLKKKNISTSSLSNTSFSSSSSSSSSSSFISSEIPSNVSFKSISPCSFSCQSAQLPNYTNDNYYLVCNTKQNEQCVYLPSNSINETNYSAEVNLNYPYYENTNTVDHQYIMTQPLNYLNQPVFYDQSTNRCNHQDIYCYNNSNLSQNRLHCNEVYTNINTPINSSYYLPHNETINTAVGYNPFNANYQNNEYQQPTNNLLETYTQSNHCQKIFPYSSQNINQNKFYSQPLVSCLCNNIARFSCNNYLVEEQENMHNLSCCSSCNFIKEIKLNQQCLNHIINNHCNHKLTNCHNHSQSNHFCHRHESFVKSNLNCRCHYDCLNVMKNNRETCHCKTNCDERLNIVKNNLETKVNFNQNSSNIQDEVNKKTLDHFETDSGIATRCSTATGSVEM